jgi:adenosylcobinamide-phosphate synthase
VTAALYPGLLAYGCAVLLDLFVRLPSALHPVAWFGKFAELLIARAPLSGPLRAASVGTLLAIGLPALAAWLSHQLLLRCAGSWLLPALQVLLLYCCVCLYGLLDAGKQLGSALREQGLAAARAQLAWLCSRDSAELDESDLITGTIESLAENLCDSVVAPLFFLSIFGLPGAVAYRALNTLDAMIGYRGRYEWLGKPAARLDDLANLVPARLSALLLMAAGFCATRRLRMSVPRGLHTWARDHARTPSPNGGHPVAMAAGLLGVRLDKPGQYVLGAEWPRPRLEDLERALALCKGAGQLALLSASLLLPTPLAFGPWPAAAAAATGADRSAHVHADLASVNLAPSIWRRANASAWRVARG